MKAFSQLRMLLVDDQHSFHVMMKSMLINMGIINITFADTPEEARRRCSKNAYDLYLFDYNLGQKENGLQLLESLKAQKRISHESIVIIVSGDSTRAMVLSALESQPDAYIAKPFSQEQFKLRLIHIFAKKKELEYVYKAMDDGDDEVVIEHCRDLILNDSRYRSTCQNILVNTLIKLFRFDEAKEILDSILLQREQNWARLCMGIIAIYEGRYANAIVHILQVVEKQPLTIDAYRWLATANEKLGDYTEAKQQLRRATEYSPQSLTLQEKLAEAALHDHDYGQARDALQVALDLSKYSIHQTPKFLSGYVNAIIMHALHEDNHYYIANLRKQVNNALSRGRDAIKSSENFDFRAFEDVCLARVYIALGEAIKGKKMIYKAWQSHKENPADMDTELLCESVLAMYQMGEKECGDSLNKQLHDMGYHDELGDSAIDSMQHDDLIIEKTNKCEQLNSKGIEAYKQSDFNQALNLFKEALLKSPANTNVAINKAQVLIDLLDNGRGSSELRRECASTLDMLDSTPMDLSQEGRYQNLLKRFNTIKSRHS